MSSFDETVIHFWRDDYTSKEEAKAQGALYTYEGLTYSDYSNKADIQEILWTAFEAAGIDNVLFEIVDTQTGKVFER
jgi:hypothetical protein